MAEAISNPMIGESYPLPRGGGFRCAAPSGPTADAPELGGWVLHCEGPDAGGRRENIFYVTAPGAAPILERVRWVVRAPAPARLNAWRSLYRELADSLSRTLGTPQWAGTDSFVARWPGAHHVTTVRLHAGSEGADSLEITSLSRRLAAQ